MTERHPLEPPPGPALSVQRALKAAGHEAWFVGGCVRDRLLGRPVNDWDLATEAEPEAVMALFPRAIATGLQHGTVTVVEGGLPVEVTTYRVEVGYSDGRRPDEVRFTRDLKEDLGRRDFTINAMAWDPDAAAVVDPYDGRGDLAERRLRAVGEPLERFTEDGLRPMRAVRFAAVLDLEIHAPTWAAIGQTVGTFAKVSAERIRIELEKTLRCPRAAWGVGALRETGLLEVFWPPLAALGEAAFEETLGALARAPEGLVPRLAVLLRRVADPGPLLEGLRFSRAEIRGATHLHACLSLEPGVERSDAEVRGEVARVGRGALDDLLGAGRAWDPAGWSAFAARVEETGARDVAHVPRELAIDGKQVMATLSLPPSRLVGRILDALLCRVWVDPALNEADRLSALLPEVLAEVEGR